MVLSPNAAAAAVAGTDGPSPVLLVAVVVAGVGASRMRALEVFFWRRE
jgi:hypothetical protein